MCSSFAERYLFSPHDLLALTALARAAGNEVFFIDAVAESLQTENVIQQIKSISPELIISIMSFELFDKDVNEVKKIKYDFTNITYGLFGHYPTHFEFIVLS